MNRVEVMFVVTVVAGLGALSSAAAADTPGCCSQSTDTIAPISVTYGASYGEPFGISGSVGAVFPDVRRLGAPLSTATRWVAMVEAGRRAAAVRFGTGLLIKSGPRWKPLFPVAGGAITASLTRTWDEPTLRRHYVGLEAHLTLLYVRGRLGYHWSVDEGPGRRRFWSWGIGVGF